MCSQRQNRLNIAAFLNKAHTQEDKHGFAKTIGLLNDFSLKDMMIYLSLQIENDEEAVLTVFEGKSLSYLEKDIQELGYTSVEWRGPWKEQEPCGDRFRQHEAGFYGNYPDDKGYGLIHIHVLF